MPAFPSPQKIAEPAGRSRLAGWRRFLPLIIERTATGARVRVLWGELAASVCAALVFGYAALASSAWLFLKYQRGFAEVRYLDVLVPGRWHSLRVATGEHYIALAQKQLAAGEPSAALYSLRIGVARSPANVPGRLLLAQLLTAARRDDLAAQTLLAGLPVAGHNPAFLQALFGFFLQRQEDATVLARARELLGNGSLPPESAAVAALAAATASFFRGNYDQAEDFLTAHRLDRTYNGRLLAAQIEWERGYRDLALLRLRDLVEEFPASEPARIQLGTWLRAQGFADEFRRFSLLREIASPQSLAPRIDLLRALRQDGDRARLDREIDSLLAEFSTDEKSLLAVADFAASTGDATLARRIYEHCRSHHLAWEAPAFLTIETLVVTRDYRGALDLADQLVHDNPDWGHRYYALLNSLQAIAYYGLGDSSSAQLYLANFLGQSDLRAENLLAVAQRFADIGATAEARETLAHAIVADPLNQAALTRLIQLDLELNQLDSLPANLRRLLAMRRPSPEVLRAAYRKLGSDLFLFSRERDATLAALQHALAAAPAPRPPR